MTPDKLNAAIAEATRFLERAYALQKEGGSTYYGSKESGAVRRSSMDLTRALSDLRRY